MIGLVSSVLGFGLFGLRACQALSARARVLKTGARERVSVVIPARNEESNIQTILRSFQRVEGVDLELVVVDDQSQDRTAHLVREMASLDPRIKLIEAGPRPKGWSGKNWACHRGSEAASFDWLLFTDADTLHRPQGLKQTLALMEEDSLDLCSAIPFHRCETLWERLLGPFHFFVFVSSAAFLKPRKKQLFAIGQFLLFKRQSYQKQGGHEAIKASLTDDLDLANACLEAGGRYGVERTGQVFEVRMYPNFNAFIEGWRRIFRLGFAHANVFRVAEIYLMLACLMMSFQFGTATRPEVALSIAAVVVLTVVQRRFGRFSALGPVLAPFGVGTFVAVTLLSSSDRLLKRDLRWRGRAYKSTVSKRH